MSRSAFTMIELIFVIVILGVLAAVAIPKLSATRDDAIVVRVAQSVSTAAMEIATYAVANGVVDDNLSVMSNSIQTLVSKSEATLDIPNRAADIQMGNTNNCLKIRINASGQDENLTVQNGPAGDNLCEALQRVFPSSAYPIALRGVRVVY